MKSLITISFLLLAGGHGFGQIYITPKQFKTKTIIGKWLLEKKVCYKEGDTIVVEPSPKLIEGVYSAIHKPTEITINQDSTFNISQWCYKCPFIDFNGIYVLKNQLFENKEQTSIIFIEQRDNFLKKKQKSFTSEFNGIIEIIENDSIKIIDDKNCIWFYIRDNEMESK